MMEGSLLQRNFEGLPGGAVHCGRSNQRFGDGTWAVGNGESCRLQTRKISFAQMKTTRHCTHEALRS